MSVDRLPWRAVSAGLVCLLLTNIGAGAPYQDVVIADNPIGYYRLNETTGTVASNAVGTIHGTYQGFVDADLGQPGALDGPLNTAARFNGSESSGANVNRVVIDQNLLAGIGTGPFAIELLAQKTVAGRGDLFNLKGSGGDLGLIWDYDEKPYIFWNVATTTKGAALPLNQYHHLVVTRDNASQMTMYVDGLVYGTGSNSANLNAIQHAIWIGSNHDNSDNPSLPFNGLVDEIAIYDRVLTADEISLHYAASLVPEPSTLASLAAGLAGLLLCRIRRRGARTP
jgi:hypothetical protein